MSEPHGARPAELIRDLSLRPHPEGGWYAEVFRSRKTVKPGDRRETRSAVTTIYFLLTQGQRSKLHRVQSDEIWHFYEGDPLSLVTCDPDFGHRETVTLGRWDGTRRPVHVVSAGNWQAAATLGDYSLVGCTVGPGFEFEDFALLRDDADEADRVRHLHPDLATDI